MYTMIKYSNFCFPQCTKIIHLKTCFIESYKFLKNLSFKLSDVAFVKFNNPKLLRHYKKSPYQSRQNKCCPNAIVDLIHVWKLWLRPVSTWTCVVITEERKVISDCGVFKLKSETANLLKWNSIFFVRFFFLN